MTLRDDKRHRAFGMSDTAAIRLLVALVVVVVLLVAIGVVVTLWSGADNVTKVGAIGDVLAGGAFLLATLAAIVAVLAYRAAILKPDLRAEVRFGHGANGMTLTVDPPNPKAGGQRFISPWIQCDVHIHLHNHGQVSARLPALKFVLENMMFPGTDCQGWTYGGHLHGLGGYTWAQWDGGADYAIHPKWGRDLPILRLYGVVVFTVVDAAMRLEIVADGFSWTGSLPVTFKLAEAQDNDEGRENAHK